MGAVICYLYVYSTVIGKDDEMLGHLDLSGDKWSLIMW